MKYHEKAKLAIKIVDKIYALRSNNSEGLGLCTGEFKQMLDFWGTNTRKPFSKEDYYRAVEASIAHLRIKHQPWDET
jgi:hypothetical protein